MTVPDSDYFARLGQRFAQAQDEELVEHDRRPAARARLLAASSGRALSRLSFRLALVPALTLALGALLFLGLASRSAPLTFAVGASQGQAGQLVTAGADAAVPLRFSDGSVLELTPQARSRVLVVEPNGARVELERGALQASVVHRADTAWAVVAGPFQVAVTGTKFVTRWDPLTRELEVTVREGSVVVSGGTLRTPERITHGKTLRVSMAPSTKQAPSLRVTSPNQAGAEAGAATEAPEKAQPQVGKSPAPDPLAFRAVFESGSPTDLVTLSKELRQRGDLNGAARALMALRARFPKDPRSALAAHALAEIALGRKECAEARRWLEAYLAQAPTGATRTELGQRVQECGRR